MLSKKSKHELNNKTLVILVALGSPTSINIPSIKSFLRMFLGDRRVVDLPKIIWYPVLYLIILPFRSKKLLHKYQLTAINDQSALIHHTSTQLKNLQAINTAVDIKLSYTYVKPSIADIFDEYHTKHQSYPADVLFIPTFPQFSSSTALPVFDQIYDYFRAKSFLPSFKFISSFATHSSYISAIVNSIQDFWASNTKTDVLLFSFHSIPVKMIKNGDTYFDECYKTYDLVRNTIGLSTDECQISFQSKFGGAKWLEPSTLSKVNSLNKNGVKSLAVICPGFLQDCLETLEEINLELRDEFMSNGGERFYYIPCLNGSDSGVNLLNQLIKDNLTKG